MTCPWTLLKDLLAFEIKSPRTKAAIVATIAIDTETKLLVWSVKCCSDTRRRTIAPANAPVKTTAKTRRAMMSELNIIPIQTLAGGVGVIFGAVVRARGIVLAVS